MAKTKFNRLRKTRKTFRKTRRNKRTLKRKYNKKGWVIRHTGGFTPLDQQPDDLYNKIIQILKGEDDDYPGHRATSLAEYFNLHNIFSPGTYRGVNADILYEIPLSEWNQKTGKNWITPYPPNPDAITNYSADLAVLNNLLRTGGFIEIDYERGDGNQIYYVKIYNGRHV